MLDTGLEDLRRMLRQLDDPTHLESPADYDRVAVERSFDELVVRLETDFECKCIVDAGAGVQDASHFGHVVVPAAALRSDLDLFVRVSNFGNLVTFGLGAPGRYSDDELALLLSASDRQLVVQALSDGGFIVVPEDLLWERYDGQVEWLKRDTRPQWFTRFFNYL